MSSLILLSLLFLLSVAFVFGVIAKRLNMPPVVGYLLAGLVLGLSVGDKIKPEAVTFLSELGIILLLFTLGLEFPLGKVKKIARIATIGALVQILGTTLILTFIGIKFGFPFFENSFYLPLQNNLESLRYHLSRQ